MDYISLTLLFTFGILHRCIVSYGNEDCLVLLTSVQNQQPVIEMNERNRVGI